MEAEEVVDELWREIWREMVPNWDIGMGPKPGPWGTAAEDVTTGGNEGNAVIRRGRGGCSSYLSLKSCLWSRLICTLIALLRKQVVSRIGMEDWSSPCPKLGGDGVGTARGMPTPLPPLFSLPPLPPLLPLHTQQTVWLSSQDVCDKRNYMTAWHAVITSSLLSLLQQLSCHWGNTFTLSKKKKGELRGWHGDTCASLASGWAKQCVQGCSGCRVWLGSSCSR